MIIKPTPATGLEREPLDAFAQLDAAAQAHDAARVRYFAVLDRLQAQDREREQAQR